MSSTSAAAPVLVWFRRDLRLADNPALAGAAKTGRPVACVYVLDEETPDARPLGGAARWWLHQSLASLGEALRKAGAHLMLRRGRADQVILKLAQEIGAAGVYWNRTYEPFAITRDTSLKSALKASGLTAESFKASLLFEPWEVRNNSGEPFKVFSAFWRAALKQGGVGAPLAAPERLNTLPVQAASDSLSDWRLSPTKPNWAAAFPSQWRPGEAGAAARLERFLHQALADYPDDRNRPDLDGTSGLSPHLAFGEISPRQIWAAVEARRAVGEAKTQPAEKFLAEIGWREFSYHLLAASPDLPTRNWRAAFDAFPWLQDPAALQAWQAGRTGYPIVDAGMRQLWATGWMHNRVRMITASFLIKHLLIDWRSGEDWFWDTLVDADLAVNAASWQWVAGSGADAAPYFRIFAPVTQGEKFDPEGEYVKRWLPELAGLPKNLVHKPWLADASNMRSAGVELGRDYPHPIVDHASARARALAAFETIKAPGSGNEAGQ